MIGKMLRKKNKLKGRKRKRQETGNLHRNKRERKVKEITSVR